jgi:hypothetical protein
MKNKIKYIGVAVRWFDKVNGNTYHSVRITRCADGKVLSCPFTYGYGDSYRQTALEAMNKAGWLPCKYMLEATDRTPLNHFERENNYPIDWNVSEGLKRDCIANGKD